MRSFTMHASKKQEPQLLQTERTCNMSQTVQKEFRYAEQFRQASRV